MEKSDTEDDNLITTKERRAYKQQALTKLLTKISATDFAAASKASLAVLESRLISIYAEFETLCQEAFALGDKSTSKADEFEERYINALTLLKENLSHSSSHNQSEQKIKLPVIQIPLFNGKSSDYKTFIGLFESLIDKDRSLDDIKKLYYLRNFVTNDPYDLIKNLPLVGESYHESLKIGCPAKLTTDQGRQFESNVFKELMKCLGIVKTRTTPYHPQCNGLVERWYRSLKAAYMARLDSKAWVEELPIVLLGLRAAPRTDSGVSAAEMTYRQTLRLAGDFYNDSIIPILDHCQYVKHLRAMIYNLKPKPLPRKDAHTVFVHSDLNNCTQVFVRSDIVKKSLEPPYEGPYKVLNRTEKVFLVQFPNRDAYISVDRLKPAYMYTAEAENNLVIKNNLSTDRLKISDHNKEPIGTSENSDQNRSANYRVTRSGRIVKPPVRFAD
uniref:Integrase catalytic domain-containing protein n=1 Tax=Bombyx mori TaxID=7091 RepID=A0A8R2RAX3_BOMMO|nr:uncharacterized protein LOC101747165 isoform X1 [Bombyx mori]